MAITYIKLGPIGDAFDSNELGIHLTLINAQEVDEILLTTRLKQFFLTGFLVEISKIEYDNIKIRTSNARNIPLIALKVFQNSIIEPVEKVLRIPPTDVLIGRRYLVYKNAEGPWKGYDDYITSFNGQDWDFIKPENGFILPVYEWGISLHYSGTYPSGKWDLDESKFTELTKLASEDLLDEAYALSLFEKERKERIEADDELRELINNQTPPPITAAGVPIEDVNGYYNGSNVELALIEIALILRAQGTSITNISSELDIIRQILTDLTNSIDIPDVTYNLNNDTETTITVGGLEQGSTFSSQPVQEIIYDILNPRLAPVLTLELSGGEGLNSAGDYEFKKGFTYAPTVNWAISKRSFNVEIASVTNIDTLSPDLPTALLPLGAGTLNGTGLIDVFTQGTDGSIGISVEDTNETVSTKNLDFKWVSPILFGNVDAADLGKTGSALYAVLGAPTYQVVGDIIKTFSYTNKYMVIAIPTRYSQIIKALDQSLLDNTLAFNQRTASLTTSGLSSDYTESYTVYEAKYNNTINGVWKFTR